MDRELSEDFVTGERSVSIALYLQRELLSSKMSCTVSLRSFVTKNITSQETGLRFAMASFRNLKRDKKHRQRFSQKYIPNN